MDPDEYRDASRTRWANAAAGWERHNEWLLTQTMPVARWLVEAISPQPGQTVLELAAGVGETGFLAAEHIQPAGRLITSDGAPEMLAAARRRAAELGVQGVEFAELEAEWIDLPTATIDAVICRWGYMLLADPDAALRETRRVLRVGGTVALAAWASADENPWATEPQRLLLERGVIPPPEPGGPGMFAWADGYAVAERLRDAGFVEPRVEAVEFEWRYEDSDHWWSSTLDLSALTGAAVRALPEAEQEALRIEFAARAARFGAAGGGGLLVPARSNAAAASA